jgi:DnaJ like chaperone protein
VAIIVGVIGYMIYGLIGAFIGIYIGVLLHKYFFKRLSPSNFSGLFKNKKKVEEYFFKATFLVMGKLAKIDSVVNKREIKAAQDWMSKLKMNEAEKLNARKYFNQGKQPDSEAEIISALTFLGKKGGKLLCRFFIEIQLSVAYADTHTEISAKEVLFLRWVSKNLSLSLRYFNWIYNYFRIQRDIYHRYKKYQAYHHTRISSIDNSYKILGVSKKASDAEVKKSYRKLMSQHHPDKLVARGLPESMSSMAKQKSQEIQAAYDEVKKHRKAKM